MASPILKALKGIAKTTTIGNAFSQAGQTVKTEGDRAAYIMKKGKEMGKDDAFIKQAIEVDAQRRKEQTPSTSSIDQPLQTEQPQQNQGFFSSLGKNLVAAPRALFYEPTVGAAKGALSTVAGGTQLVGQGLRAVTNPFTKAVAGKDQAEYKNPISEKLREASVPTNPYQAIGFGAEQIAEFFVPGGAVTKGVKAIGAAKAITKLPKIAQAGAKLAGAAGLEAASFGGVTALQEGEINDVVKNSALAGAAFPVAGAALGKALTKVLPSRLINSLIKPPAKEFRFGKNPGLAVAMEGIKANTLEDLGKKIISKKAEIGKKIGAQVKGGIGAVDAGKIIGETANKFTSKVTDPAAAQRFQNIMDQLLYDVKFSEGQIIKTAKKDLSKLNAEEIHLLQQKIGDLTQWTGQGYEKEVNQILSSMYREVGKQLEKMSPGTKPLQQRYANLLGAEKSVENRVATVNRMNTIANVSSLGLGGIAGLGSALSGKDLQDSAMLGLLGALSGKVGGSTFIKSRLAKALAKKGSPEIVKRLSGGVTSRVMQKAEDD